MKYIKRHAFLGRVIVEHGCFFFAIDLRGLVDATLSAASTHSGGLYLFFFWHLFLFSLPFFKAFSSLLLNTLHDLLNVNITSFLPFF